MSDLDPVAHIHAAESALENLSDDAGQSLVALAVAQTHASIAHAKLMHDLTRAIMMLLPPPRPGIHRA